MAVDKKIKPELPGGVRDYLPQDAVVKERALARIKEVFSLFGFVPLETPGMERTEVLTGGDPQFSKELFYCTHKEEPNMDTALRFDLTVPLARVVAAHADVLHLPFRRYQIGSVWRGERQQAGRFKEFTQCDADIVGAYDIRADADIIALVHHVFSVLEMGKIRIRVNNRKVLEGLSEYASYEPEKNEAVIRVLDKMEKVGWKKVADELVAQVGLSLTQVDAISVALGFDKEMNLDDAIVYAHDTFGNVASAQEGIKELSLLVEGVRALGVPDEAWQIDYSVARGLSYYTGMVFETMLIDTPELGSVCSGGRYDGLVERFSASQIGAVGMSVGIDRLLSIGVYTIPEHVGAQTLVLHFDDNASVYTSHIVAALRAEGISAELYVGQEKSLKGQLSYAVKKGYPMVCIAGAKEQEQAVVQVKNISHSTQQEVPIADVVAYVCSQL